jgi:hypothetical protein
MAAQLEQALDSLFPEEEVEKKEEF